MKKKSVKKVPVTKSPRRKNIHRKILIGSLIAVAFLAVAGGLFYYVKVKPSGLTFWEASQNLANPTVKTIRIVAGLRKEEVAKQVGVTLNWTDAQMKEFIKIHDSAFNGNAEGYFFPGTYIVSPKAKPAEVSYKIVERFNERIVDKRDKMGNNAINLDTAIKIASIIQREAGSKNDMKIISGVIWNRIFQGMSLDMDATLQYAKANQTKWWPRVIPEDKYIESPYNTYKYKGFPPGAISSPSEDAIWAALNPQKSNIIFYIHDDNGYIHTARTYQEHLNNIDIYY